MGVTEIRKDDDGVFDELVSTEVKCVHLERMGKKSWWMGIDLEDGRQIHVRWTGKVPIVEVE